MVINFMHHKFIMKTADLRVQRLKPLQFPYQW